MTSSQDKSIEAGSAGKTVRAFLAAMAARDLATAEAMLAPGFRMVFPGGHAMTRLADLVAWAKSRYRSVAKDIERVETAPGAGTTTVFVTGTLFGEWPDGSRFEGIRFIDRFVLGSEGIVEQEVWNDLAEHRNAEP